MAPVWDGRVSVSRLLLLLVLISPHLVLSTNVTGLDSDWERAAIYKQKDLHHVGRNNTVIGQTTDAAEQNKDGGWQNEYGLRREPKMQVHNASVPAENTYKLRQHTCAPGRNVGALRQNTMTLSNNTDWPLQTSNTVGQGASWAYHNTTGTDQNTSAIGHNTSDQGKNAGLRGHSGSEQGKNSSGTGKKEISTRPTGKNTMKAGQSISHKGVKTSTGQNRGSTGLATSGKGENTSMVGYTTRSIAHNTSAEIQNTGGTEQNTNASSAEQATSGIGKTISGIGSMTIAPRHNTSGPRLASKTTAGTGENTNGTGQNTSRTWQKANRTRQATNKPIQNTILPVQKHNFPVSDKRARVKRLVSDQIMIQILGMPTHLCHTSTCWNRCGRPRIDPLDCGCDDQCYSGGYCCIDYEWECDRVAWEPNPYNLDNLLARRLDFLDKKLEQFSQVVNVNYDFGRNAIAENWLGYSRVHRCPVDVDDQLIGKCEYPEQFGEEGFIGQMQVRGIKNIIYKNIFCAFCHGEAQQNLTAVLTDYTCNITTSQEILSNLTALPMDQLLQKIATECAPYADLGKSQNSFVGVLTCNSSYNSTFERYHADEAACMAYTNAVILPGDYRIFKNEHCIRCSVPGTQEGPITTHCAGAIDSGSSISNETYWDNFSILYDVQEEAANATVLFQDDPLCTNPTYESYFRKTCIFSECLRHFPEEQKDCLPRYSASERWSKDSVTKKDQFMIMFKVLDADGADELLADVTMDFMNEFKGNTDLKIGDMTKCFIDEKYINSTEKISLYQKHCVMIQLSSDIINIFNIIEFGWEFKNLLNRSQLEITLTNFDVRPSWDLCQRGSNSKVLSDVHILKTKWFANPPRDSMLFAPGDDLLYSLENLPIVLTSRATNKPNWDVTVAVVCVTQNLSITGTHSQKTMVSVENLCNLLGDDINDFPAILTLAGSCLSGLCLLGTWLCVVWKRHWRPLLTASNISFVTALLIARLAFQVSGYIQLGSVLCQAVDLVRLYFTLSVCLWVNVIVFELFQDHSSNAQRMRASLRFGLYLTYGWGIGVVLVVIFLGLQLQGGVQDPGLIKCGCWISSDIMLPLGYMIPAALSVILNCILLLKNHKYVKIDSANGPLNKYIGNFRALYRIIAILVFLIGVDTGIGFLADVIKAEVLWYTRIFSNLLLSLYVLITFGIWMVKVEQSSKTDE